MTNLAQFKTRKEFIANFIECAKAHTHEEMAEKTYDACNNVYDDTLTMMIKRAEALQTKMMKISDEGFFKLQKINNRHWKIQFLGGVWFGALSCYIIRDLWPLLEKL